MRVRIGSEHWHLIGLALLGTSILCCLGCDNKASHYSIEREPTKGRDLKISQVWSSLEVGGQEVGLLLSINRNPEFNQVLDLSLTIILPIGLEVAGWDANSGKVATRCRLEAPETIKALGVWHLPKQVPSLSSPGDSAYQGQVTFQRLLRVDEDSAAEEIKIACLVRMQICSAHMCYPPRTLKLEIEIPSPD